MPLADVLELAVTILATALLLVVAGVPRYPRANAVLSLMYATAVLFAFGHGQSWRTAVLAMATGFGALALSRLAPGENVSSEHAAVGVSKLRSRIPRL
jgi:hypothetical protein